MDLNLEDRGWEVEDEDKVLGGGRVLVPAHEEALVSGYVMWVYNRVRHEDAASALPCTGYRYLSLKQCASYDIGDDTSNYSATSSKDHQYRQAFEAQDLLYGVTFERQLPETSVLTRYYKRNNSPNYVPTFPTYLQLCSGNIEVITVVNDPSPTSQLCSQNTAERL